MSGNDSPRIDISSKSEEDANITLKGEFFRKATHLGALAIPLIYYFLGRNVILILLSCALAFSLFVDYTRMLGGTALKELFQRYFGLMIRPHEKKDLMGATYILASSLITILIFEKSIAILALAYIIIGDTAGAIVGRVWGRIRFRNKTVEGSLSFFLSCCLISLAVPAVPIWIRFTGAMVAAVVEAVTVFMDDNLTVPLISGAVMQLLLR